MRVIASLRADLLGLWAVDTLHCLQRDERWSQRAGPVESLLLTGHEWRKGEGPKEGLQVNYRNSINSCSVTNVFHVSLWSRISGVPVQAQHSNKQQTGNI